MRERFRVFLDRNTGVRWIRRLTESPLYPAFFCLLVLMSFCSKVEVVFATVIIAVTAVTLVVARDLKPLIPPLFSAYFLVPLVHAPQRPTYSIYYTSPTVRVCIVVLAATLIATLIIHFWLWGGFVEMFTRKTRMTWFILPLAVALLLNGLFAEGYAPINIGFSLVTIFSWIILYLIFMFGLPHGKETVRYVANTCQWVAILLILELLYVYITQDVLEEGTIMEARILFGWGINNNFGAILTVMLPPLFYLAGTRRNGWMQFLLAVAAYAAIVASLCRAAILVGTVVFGICLLALCVSGNNRGLYRVATLSVFFFLCVSAVFLHDELAELFSSLVTKGFSGEGRLELWKGGLRIFIENPIFGGGFSSVSYHDLFHSFAGGAMPGLCHNTVIEIFCAAGAFGGISYLAYRARTVQLIVSHMTFDRFFLGMILFTLTAIGLLDNVMFNVYPMFFGSVALVLIEGDYNETLARLPAKEKKTLWNTSHA